MQFRPGDSVLGAVEFSGATVVIRATTGIEGEGGELPRGTPPLVFTGVLNEIVGVELKPTSN